jgi:hypothetical protein
MFRFEKSRTGHAMSDPHASQIQALSIGLTPPNRGAQFQLALAALQAARRARSEIETQLNGAIIAHCNQPGTAAKVEVERLEAELVPANVRVGDARKALEVERAKYAPHFLSAIGPGVVSVKVTLSQMLDQLDEVTGLLADANNFAGINCISTPPLIRDAPQMQNHIRAIRRIVGGVSR